MQSSYPPKKWLNEQKLKALFTAGALFFAGMSAISAQAAVVSSVRPLGFIAAAIADGVTSTEVLLPDGASTHDYALRPSDVQRFTVGRADYLGRPGNGSLFNQTTGTPCSIAADCIGAFSVH